MDERERRDDASVSAATLLLQDVYILTSRRCASRDDGIGFFLFREKTKIEREV